MNLAEILNEINIQKGFQAADLEPQVINGGIPQQEMARVNALAIAKRQAGDRIEELRNQYDRQVWASAAIVFVTGGDAKARTDFMARATENEAIVVDSEAFYKNIAARAEATMSGQRILSVAVGQEIVSDVARAIGNLAPGNFIQYPQLPARYIDAIFKTGAEVLEVVKAVAAPCTEKPLGITWLERNVAELAFAAGSSDDNLAIVVAVDASEVDTWASYFMRGAPRFRVDLDELDVEAAMDYAKTRLSKLVKS